VSHSTDPRGYEGQQQQSEKKQWRLPHELTEDCKRLRKPVADGVREHMQHSESEQNQAALPCEGKDRKLISRLDLSDDSINSEHDVYLRVGIHQGMAVGSASPGDCAVDTTLPDDASASLEAIIPEDYNGMGRPKADNYCKMHASSDAAVTSGATEQVGVEKQDNCTGGHRRNKTSSMQVEADSDNLASDEVCITYANFRQQQRQQQQLRQRQTSNLKTSPRVQRLGTATPEHSKPKLSTASGRPRGKGVEEYFPEMDANMDRSARIERIQKLRQERGAAPMPIFVDDRLISKIHQASPSSASDQTPRMQKGKAVAAERTVELPVNDNAASSAKKDHIHVAHAASREVEASRFEPEPELQSEDHEVTAWVNPAAAHATPRQVKTRRDQMHIGLVATQPMVEDVKRRFQSYCSEGHPRDRERAMSPNCDAVFEELQARWLRIRGMASSDLRPELQVLVAPLEMDRVRLSESNLSAQGGRMGKPPPPRNISKLSEEASDLFDQLDQDGDGVITRSELAAACKEGLVVPQKISSVVPLPPVSRHGLGRPPLAGKVVETLRVADPPRQQIDDNCVHQ